MKLELFDNNLGFKPNGRVLELWKFLPQVSIDNKVPSLFGNIKSMMLPILIVSILIICETVLLFNLNEEGAMPILLVGLTVADFVIAILPIPILIGMNLIPSVINTNLFINQFKLNTKHSVPADFNGEESNYHDTLRRQFKDLKWSKTKYRFIYFIVVALIIVFAWIKYQSIYGIFGEDILIMGTGRFAVIVIILSVITHVFFTKDVISYFAFKGMLNGQKNNFHSVGENKITNKDKNNTKEIPFDGKYNFEKSGNQMVGKVYDRIDSTIDRNKLNEFENQRGVNYISTLKSENNDNVFIVFTGILTDPEISVIATAQSDTRMAVLCTAKEIQLSFN